MRWGYGKRVPPGPPRLVAFLMGACVENRCICVAFTLSSPRGSRETRATRRARDSTARHQFICKGAAIVCRRLSSAQRSALCCCRFYDREIRARGSTQRLPAGVFFFFPHWVKSFPSRICFCECAALPVGWVMLVLLTSADTAHCFKGKRQMQRWSVRAGQQTWHSDKVLCATHPHFIWTPEGSVCQRSTVLCPLMVSLNLHVSAF